MKALTPDKKRHMDRAFAEIQSATAVLIALSFDLADSQEDHIQLHNAAANISSQAKNLRRELEFLPVRFPS